MGRQSTEVAFAFFAQQSWVQILALAISAMDLNILYKYFCVILDSELFMVQ